MFKKAFYFLIILCITISCETAKEQSGLEIKIDAEQQLQNAFDKMKKHLTELEIDSLKIPRALESDGKLIASNSRQWTSGFFPGTLWQLYNFSKDDQMLEAAMTWTAFIEKEKYDTHTHDLGFKLNSSFGKGYEVIKKDEYKDVVVQAATTLIKRYNADIGSLRSWDWNADIWQFPVIIDNMMNLELLFDAFEFTGDSTFYKIAYDHAVTTLNNHFREDHSAFHVLDYDTTTHEVRLKTTHQGYSDASAWARGQAWSLHGYTTTYIKTGDERFLDQAEHSAEFMFTHENMPDDLIPYWDYDAPNIPNEPRDVSAATVAASALLDLAEIVPTKRSKYLQWADGVLTSLDAEEYRSSVAPFLLDHSTGSVPGEFEVDVPIVYADFYYVEALLKRARIKNKN